MYALIKNKYPRPHSLIIFEISAQQFYPFCVKMYKTKLSTTLTLVKTQKARISE